MGENASLETAKEPKLKLVLSEPFRFDNQEITEIEMEGMLNLTAGDMCDIDRQMIAKGYYGSRIDTTRQYAMYVAARVNHKPWEFCERMAARDSIRLREMVATFFYARV